MIKNLKKFDIQTTPFIAVKSWNLTNSDSADLILPEQHLSSSFATEFVDYGDGINVPFINRSSNLALEQQTDDNAMYDEGENRSGFFYPDLEPQNNTTGKYKRLVYQEIKNMFYNTYKDPTKIWGIEHIDFPKSRTKRFLSDTVRVFNIPRKNFGEKLVENSIKLIDNALDDAFLITDDGYGNLVASETLFSKVQEVRQFISNVSDGYYAGTCDSSWGTSGTAGAISLIKTRGYITASCLPW